VLTATANGSAQTVDDLAESLKYAAPVAADAGESIESTSKALGVLANMGIKGSMAGTTIRQMFVRLANPEVQKTLKGIGVAAVDATGNLRPLGDIMADLGKAIAGLPNAKRLALVQDLFDQRAMSGALKLSGSADQIAQLAAAIDKAGGTAERTAKMMDSGLGGAFRMMMSAAEGVAIAVGEALSSTLSKWMGTVQKVAEAIARWVSQNKQLVATIGVVIAGLVASGAAFMVAGYAIKGLAVGVGVLSAAFGALTIVAKIAAAVIAAITSPVTLVVAAVAALAGYVLYATGAAGKAIDWLGGRFGNLADVARTTWGAIGKALARGDISAAADVLWAALKLAWVTGTNALLEVWLWFKGIFLKAAYWAFYGALEIADTVWHALKIAWIETTSFLADVWTRFAAGVTKVWYISGNALAKQWNTLSAYWVEFSSLLQTYWQKACSAVQSAWARAHARLEVAWNGLKSLWERIWNSAPVQAAAKVTGAVWDYIVEKATRAWDNLKSIASAVFDYLRRTVASAWSRLLGILGKVSGKAKEAAQEAAKVAGEKAESNPLIADATAAYERAKAKAADENRKADEQLQARLAAIDAEKKAELEKIEAARKAARDSEAQRHEQRLASLDDEYKAALAGVDKEKADRLAAARDELAKAEKAWKDAIGKADSPAGAPTGSKAPGGLASPDELLNKIGGGAAGLQDQLRGSVTGTFSAAALFGLGTKSVAERTAKATEDTAKNTKKLLDTWDYAGSAFA